MVLASVIETLHRADQELTLAVNSLSWYWSDWFWTMLSDIKLWIPTYAICAIFLFIRLGWKKALIVLASAALAFGICDQVSGVVKHAVSRLRPCYSFPMLEGGLNVLEKRGGFFGFFSAHAANAFSLAMCLTIGFRNDNSHTYNAFFKWALIWAFLVSISRVFVGKHYLGDIIVGLLIGMGTGFATGMTARYLVQRFVDKVPFTGPTALINKRISPKAPAEPSPSVSPSSL